MQNKINIGEICDFSYGESLKEETRIAGKIPVYGSNGIVGFHNKSHTSGATIIIGRKGSIGEINWSDDPCFPIDTTYYIEKTKQACDLKWLFYTLLSAGLTELNKSAAVPGLNREDAYEQLVPFPSLSEQKRIAVILEKADKLRRLRRYALEMSETFLQTIFLEMFGDVSTHQKYKITLLKDVSSKITDGVHFKPDYLSAGVPFISVKDITTGKLKFDDCKFISHVDHEKFIKRCKPEIDDVLYTKVGATYGRPAIVDTEKDFSLYVSVCLIKPIKSIVLPYYLFSALKSLNVKSQADKSVKGIGVPDLHLDQIQKFLIPMPPIHEQEKFVSLLLNHERIKRRQTESLRQSEHLFQTLLHRAFTEGI